MNHIYKTVWNATLGAWTVAQETAKARGKSSGGNAGATRGAAHMRFAYTAVASALLLASGQAVAVTGAEGGNTTTGRPACFYDTASQSVLCGDASTSVVDIVDTKTAKSVSLGLNAKTTGESNVALGANSSASHTSGLAIGANAKAHHNQTVAVGERASATGEADVAIGKAAAENAVSTGRNVAIGGECPKFSH